jgi:Rieske Fe-S protein
MNVGFDCRESCPWAPSRDPALAFPVGQVRRFAASNEEEAGEVDETKRNVLKLLAVGGLIGAGAGGLVGGSLQYLQPPAIGLSSYPRVQLLDVDGSPLTVAKVEAEYSVGTSDLYLFNYPLRNEPNFLLNLYPANGNPPSSGNPGAENVLGGVGTHKSIVAFSGICQHLGCPAPAIAFYPPGTCPNTPGGKTFYLHCSCHGSTYDPTNGASNLTGPAVMPLPQVTLEPDASGNIFATGVTGPPVNGHISTLQGDYGVGSTSQVVKESPVILCNFPV